MAPKSKQQGTERFVVLTTDRLCFAQSIHQRVRGNENETVFMWGYCEGKECSSGYRFDLQGMRKK